MGEVHLRIRRGDLETQPHFCEFRRIADAKSSDGRTWGRVFIDVLAGVGGGWNADRSHFDANGDLVLIKTSDEMYGRRP